jgi:predicted  nucleic acid-binding Zn-ribbon protein
MSSNMNRRYAALHSDYRQQNEYLRRQLRNVQEENAKLSKDVANLSAQLMHCERQLAKTQVELQYNIKLAH